MQEVCNKCEGTGAGLMLECSKCDGIGYVYGDAVLSDLEIVHKALSKSGAVLTMYLDGSGNVNSLIDEDENILSFSKAKELLAWAKQTLEQ